MKILNRKFRREYQEIEKLEVGIVLTGAEVKSVRAGRIRLDDAFVKILGSEAYLVNGEIAVYEYARPQLYEPRRTRKLLLHKNELIRLRTKISSAGGLTIVPVSCYNKDGFVKLEIALARPRKERGTKKFDKQRDIKREEEKKVKEYLKN